MLTKKVYIPIVLGLGLLAVGFLVLRSDVVDEPIKIYKAVEPLPKSTAEVPVGETSTRPAETGNVPTGNEPPDLVNTPDETTDTPMSDETEALPNETETLDLTDAFLPDDIATLEDPTLVALNSERLKLKQRQAELNALFQDHFAAVVGRKLTVADTRHGNLVSGNADGLTESQVIAELENLRSRSENLRKAQVEWRRKYIQHTGKEYPGTEHWGPRAARDPEEVQKLLQYEMGARDWFIVDP